MSGIFVGKYFRKKRAITGSTTSKNVIKIFIIFLQLYYILINQDVLLIVWLESTSNHRRHPVVRRTQMFTFTVVRNV